MSDYEKIGQPENKAESEDEIATRLKEKLSQKYAEPLMQKMQNMEHVGKFGDYLRKKYPDYKSYRLFHVLAFSNQLPDTTFTHFDFPGEDSVQKFIEGL